VSNGFTVAVNGANLLSAVGIVEFHYDLNTHGVGNTRPVITTGTNGYLKIENHTYNANGDGSGMLSSRLNLVLNAAPTVIASAPQNLGLFADGTKGILGNGTFPKVFYTMDGLTGYSSGATISATYGSTEYSWTISYSGVITFTDSTTSAYTPTNVAASGGNDVVLIGASTSLVPEPGTLALLGGAGSLILARRRGKKA